MSCDNSDKLGIGMSILLGVCAILIESKQKEGFLIGEFMREVLFKNDLEKSSSSIIGYMNKQDLTFTELPLSIAGTIV